MVAESAGDSWADPAPQVAYLARYCERLGAQSFVTEKEYVDRHYVDEYGAYYGRLPEAPSRRVRRLHLFSRRISKPGLTELLNTALRSPEARVRIERELSRTTWASWPFDRCPQCLSALRSFESLMMEPKPRARVDRLAALR